MSIIEQAAKRLEELRRAGAVVHELPGSKQAAAGIVSADAKDVRAGFGLETPDAVTPDLTTASSTRDSAPIQSRGVTLDLAKLAAAGFVTPDVSRSRIGDEFRILKRPLLANAAGKTAAPIKNGNLIMVTSAVPGEGKSFSAINLAISIAMELDRSVLLVDADVAKPSHSTVFGLPALKGLLDVLQDKSLSLSDVLLRTNVEKLSLLPAGTQTARANEVLASGDMTDLLEEMAGRYSDRIIIFDSPPLLVTTESRVLATHMGQIVFVVHAESTLQSQVKQALATIEACPIKLMVLNQARTTAQGAYGYGYGYGYGSGNGK